MVCVGIGCQSHLIRRELWQAPKRHSNRILIEHVLSPAIKEHASWLPFASIAKVRHGVVSTRHEIHEPIGGINARGFDHQWIATEGAERGGIVGSLHADAGEQYRHPWNRMGAGLNDFPVERTDGLPPPGRGRNQYQSVD